MTPPKLGIIAGSGALPVRLAEACHASGRPYFILALEGAADRAALADFPHAFVRIGAVGEALEILRREGVAELVMAGGVKRPSMASLMPDAVGAKLLAKLGLKLFAGDDALLRAVAGFLESEGFRIVGADDILAGLTAPEGTIAGPPPDARAREAVALGLRVARALGALDVGQAVIVEEGCVLGVEAAEGTDALIARCAGLSRERGRAVLVKAKKPGQDARTDLPAIGPDTLTRLREANMLGLAVEAGSALLLDAPELKRRAEEYGLFVIGVQ